MSRLALLLLLSSLGSSAAYCADPISASTVAKPFLDRGEKLRGEGQFDLAIAEFDTAIKIDPTNAISFACRAFCWAKKRDHKRALADYDEAIKLDPKTSAYFRDRGSIWAGSQQWDKAITDLDQAIRLNPNDANSFSFRAAVRVQKGEWANVVQDCGEAIRLDPKRIALYELRAAAHGILGQWEAALADMDKILELNPDDGKWHTMRVALLWSRQEWKKVANACDEAIRLGVKEPDLFVRRGNVRLMFHKGDYERVFKDYDEALKLNHNHVKALVDRSLLLAACPDARYRDSRKAAADAAMACELTGWKDPWAISSLAAACTEDGEFEAAVKWQKRALDNPAFISNYADACERLKLYEKKKPYRLPEK